MEDRTVTYPGDIVQHVAEVLCDIDGAMDWDTALAEAFSIVIDVTMAVDKLRQSEANNADH